jgi:hypothetical protein
MRKLVAWCANYFGILKRNFAAPPAVMVLVHVRGAFVDWTTALGAQPVASNPQLMANVRDGGGAIPKFNWSAGGKSPFLTFENTNRVSEAGLNPYLFAH